VVDLAYAIAMDDFDTAPDLPIFDFDLAAAETEHQVALVVIPTHERDLAAVVLGSGPEGAYGGFRELTARVRRSGWFPTGRPRTLCQARFTGPVGLEIARDVRAGLYARFSRHAVRGSRAIYAFPYPVDPNTLAAELRQAFNMAVRAAAANREI
jgi:hypothetical protein